MKRSNLGQALLAVAVCCAIGAEIPCGMAAQPANAELRTTEFSAQARAIPFPPDAREVEFDATFDEIEFTSRSSLASLTAFYLREMPKRGWEHDASAAEQDKDSVKLTFKHDGAQVIVDLDQGSDDVDVSMDCEGLDFEGTADPAALIAAGVPQPRAYVFLQKEIPRPADVVDLHYSSDECNFKSQMPLQAAFDYYLKALKGLGWRESRRPIVDNDRRYTEFKRGPITVSVNIFSDEVGSRIILGYEDDRKEPVVPPLAVASMPVVKPGSEPIAGDSPAAPPTAKQAVDVSTNAGTATVVQGRNRHVFKYVAAYRSKDDGETTTLVFSEKPIPLQKMQTMLATEEDFSFGDLYEFSMPGSIRIEVGPYTSFSFNSGGVGIGNSLDDGEAQIKVEQGRARGSIKMRETKQIFDEPFHVSATIDAAVLTPDTRLGGAAAQPQVTRRESPFPTSSELLLPDDAGNVQSEGTRYRKSTHAEVSLDLPAVASFYRTELAAQQWKEEGGARAVQPGDAAATLVFRSPAGKMTVKLQRSGERTVIDVASVDDAKARSDGLLPEPGKARIMMGNAHTRDVVIAIGKQDYPLKAGRGAGDPKTALNYSVAPGAYVITVKIPGEAPQTETLNVTAGTTWGILALPTGGYMASQLY